MCLAQGHKAENLQLKICDSVLGGLDLVNFGGSMVCF